MGTFRDIVRPIMYGKQVRKTMREFKGELKEGVLLCDSCGRKIKTKDIKGKGVKCWNLLCNSCGKIKDDKIYCPKCVNKKPLIKKVDDWVMKTGRMKE